MQNGNSFIDYHDFINPNPLPPNMPLQPSTAEIVAPCPNPMSFVQVFNPLSQFMVDQSRVSNNQAPGINASVAEPDIKTLDDKTPKTRVHELEKLQTYALSKV